MADSASVATSVMGSARKRARKDNDEQVADTLNGLQQEALDELNEHLTEFPGKIETVLRFARKTNVTLEKKAIVDEADCPFHSSYCKLYRVPKDFLRGWLPSLCENVLRISADQLQRLEKHADGSIRNIFNVITNTIPETSWPQYCHDQKVFKRTFEKAHKEFGNRIEKLILREKGDKVLMDDKAFGIYILGPPGGCPKTYIEHINGTRADLVDFPIPNNDYVINDNVNPLKANVKVKRSTAKCIDFFSETQVDQIKAGMQKMKSYLQDIAKHIHIDIDNEVGSQAEEECACKSEGSAPSAKASPAPAPPKASPGKLVVAAKAAK